MKTFQRILFGLGALLLLFVIFLAGSIAVDYLIGGDRLREVTNTNIPGANSGPAVAAYVARPDGNGPFPVVIMIHEFYGLNENIVGKADGLAEEGYVVVAPDTFRGSSTAWIPRAIFQVITTRSEQVNQDLDSVYTWIVAQSEFDPERIGVLGFCYGGRASLTYSLNNPGLAATVIFYGSPETDPKILGALPGPVLGIFGGADTSIPLEEVYAFEAGLDRAGVPNEITIYEGQPHAFLTSIQDIRAGGVQQQAWMEMLAFLETYLKAGRSSGMNDSEAAYRAPFAWRYYAMLVYEHARGSASHSH